MKILCVHGVGRHDPKLLEWQKDWQNSILQAYGAVHGAAPVPEIEFCMHDELFSQQPLTAWQTLEAIATLGGSLISSTMERGIFDGDNIVGWTAGMVLQWAGNDSLRQAARDKLRQKIVDWQPDVICAHSLGSVIAYDLLNSAEGQPLAKGRTLLTFGSQINSRFVSGIFEFGVVPLPATARWFHIFNQKDPVFTAQIDFEGATNFLQVVTTPFGFGITAHTDLKSYLNDSKVLEQVWTSIVSQPSAGVRDINVAPKRLSISAKLATERAPTRRALLIGINEYNNPENRLEGCVNDVFEVSALLQECGFSPDEIRVVFDRRATADGIRDRLSWLFSGVEDGDVRVLFYSGHGLQMPVYGRDGKPSRMVEALVAADFDGTLKNCITDQDLSVFYSKLPRGCRAIIALDCCHAGGLSRQGGPRIRGIDPPDDVRHRMLKWDPTEEMWVPREIAELIPEGTKPDKKEIAWRTSLAGQSGCVERLGVSVDQRRLSSKEFDQLRKSTGWKGPFLPIIITACDENQKSSEYLNGSASYGAFTFAFCRTIRKARNKGQSMTYQQAVEEVGKTLTHLHYDQTPGLTAPDALKELQIPFLSSTPVKNKPAKQAKPKRPATKKRK